MIRQLKQSRVLRELGPGEMRLAYAGHGQGAAAPRWPLAGSTTPRLPRRPDASVISEAIPLFYIGRNKNGLWVVREAEGCIGGIFLTRRSAVRFARESCEHTGCATMFVGEPLELDFEHRGNLFVAERAAARSVAADRAQALLTAVAAMRGAFRRFLAKVSQALAGDRSHRQAIEQELFRGQYTLSSKNDDDLPIP
jgi:hypothetical protein